MISSEKIIKVFHDCLEDISLLNSYGNLSKFNSIFDTQIAHRICFNAENNCNSIGTKNISISLKELLKYYFNIKPELKDEIHDLMSKKPYLWKNRPLTEKLIYYAGCDVKYLPKIFDIICKKCDKGIYKNIKIENIFEECKKYLKYLDLNKEVKNFNRKDLTKGKKLSGLIKNFQHKCIFIQLNIGFMGIVTDTQSVSTLKEKYKLGDITDFIIHEIEDKKKKLILILSNENNAANNISNNISNNNIRENLKAIIKKKEKEEKSKKDEIDNKSLHEGININKKGFYPKNYFNNKYHFVNNNTSPNNPQMINTTNNKMNIYNYNNNINTIGNKTFSGHFYYNNYNNGNLVNNGWLYNGEDNNTYFFEQPDENNASNNFYYVINKYQDNLPNRYIRQQK